MEVKMYFNNDYIMRQLENMTRALANILFDRDIPAVELIDVYGNLTSSGILYHRLRHQVAEGKICQAEDLLFDEIRRNPLPAHLSAAVEFYNDLSRLTDSDLERGGFSRMEISEGIKDVMKLYEI
jgi:hypothetical protein